MSRQTIIAPIGLITQPNEYGQYKRGALKIAKNVCMRSPGIIGSLPSLVTQDGTYGDTSLGRIIGAMLAGDAKVIKYAGDNTLAGHNFSWTSFTSSYSNIPRPTAWGGAPYLISSRFARFRNRFLFAGYLPFTDNASPSNGNTDAIIVDSEGGTTARYAGISPPLTIGFEYATGDVMADNTACAYRALFRRIHSDGYETVSAPSVRLVMANSSGSTKTTKVYVYIPHVSGVLAGDICELYRTATVSGTTTDPGDVCYLAMSQVVTSTDVSNNYVSITDGCPDGGLGVELYTNQGQEGAQSPNYPPPHGADLAMFKGHMFYVANEVPAQATIGPQNAMGFLSTDFERTYGIGRRDITGTFSSGSPIITAVNNIRGIVIGQMVYNSHINGGNGSTAIGVTATTITVSHNSAGSAAADATQVYDQIRYQHLPSMTSEITAIDWRNVWFSSAFVAGSVQSSLYEQFQNGSTYAFSAWWASGVAYHGASAIFRHNHVWDGAFTLRATNGANYAPPLPEYGATANSYSPQVKKNRIAWSKFQQPEHCPPLNYAFVGSGEVYRIIPTRDALWIFCSDGLHRLSGNGGTGATGEFAWQEDMADPNLILAARNAVCTLKETVWCYTNRGLVAISDDGGIQEISLGVIGELPGAAFAESFDTFMAADEAHAEIWLSFRSGTYGSGATTTYVFNTLTKTFVTFNDGYEYSVSAYAPSLRSLILGRVGTGSTIESITAPFVYYFNDDSSSSRLANAQVSYQPLYVSDPFNLKQFVDVSALFYGVNASATLTPTFDVKGTGAVDNTVTVTMKQSAGETYQTWGVPRRAAIAPSLRPGWKINAAVSAPWSFKGLSARFTPGGEDVSRA